MLSNVLNVVRYGTVDEDKIESQRSIRRMFLPAVLLANLVCFGPLYLMGHSSTVSIDATTPESFEASLSEIQKTISAEEWTEFQESLGEIRRDSTARNNGLDADEKEYRFRKSVHKMSGHEIITQGKRLKRIHREKLAEMYPHLRNQLQSE